ncbi:MAG TPA: hypothetical protein VGQ00_00260 [Candidatus Norongarragalinales archaeon]|jgi:hypothetical protein|nr:hypothetical protein [Candidatus Norongarragalinales archaeon]
MSKLERFIATAHPKVLLKHVRKMKNPEIVFQVVKRAVSTPPVTGAPTVANLDAELSLHNAAFSKMRQLAPAASHVAPQMAMLLEQSRSVSAEIVEILARMGNPAVIPVLKKVLRSETARNADAIRKRRHWTYRSLPGLRETIRQAIHTLEKRKEKK